MDANKIKQMNEELLKSDTNIFQLYKVSRVIPFSKENKISIALLFSLSFITSLGVSSNQIVEKIGSLSPIISSISL